MNKNASSHGQYLCLKSQMIVTEINDYDAPDQQELKPNKGQYSFLGKLLFKNLLTNHFLFTILSYFAIESFGVVGWNNYSRCLWTVPHWELTSSWESQPASSSGA